jgi:hypothetical protein
MRLFTRDYGNNKIKLIVFFVSVLSSEAERGFSIFIFFQNGQKKNFVSRRQVFSSKLSFYVEPAHQSKHDKLKKRVVSNLDGIFLDGLIRTNVCLDGILFLTDFAVNDGKKKY